MQFLDLYLSLFQIFLNFNEKHLEIIPQEKKLIKGDLFKVKNNSYCTEIKFSIKDFFSKCDQIRRKLRILSHLLKISSMENFIFLVQCHTHLKE